MSVSRAESKLEAALRAFGVAPRGWVCADLGSNVGGFVACLLHHGAARVYAVERGWGVLDYRLRTDARVVVRERCDALRLVLSEPVRLVTIDVGWTRQERILPAAARLLEPVGQIITLVKPHYEADPRELRRGVLPDDRVDAVVRELRRRVTESGFDVLAELDSPIRGRAGNREVLWHVAPRALTAPPLDA